MGVRFQAVALLLMTLFGTAAAQEIRIQIVLDNTSASPEFAEDWGFSALVTTSEARVLFDSGGDPELLLKHLELLAVDPKTITHAVISHNHADHRKGIFRLALRNHAMQVFFLDSFPAPIYETAMAVGIDPQRVKGPARIAPGIYTTGALGEEIPEQALIVDSAEGPVVLVGGGHVGLTTIVEAVEKQRGVDSIRLLLGGFHMIRMDDEEIARKIAGLHRLNVRSLAPTHCTGEKAKRLLRKDWPGNVLAAGAGREIVLQ